MQIKIENFGPIKSFDFDLDKDFHVIYGKNNIGKSYAISLIYVVLKVILDLQESKELYILYNSSDFFKNKENTEKIIEVISTESEKDFNLLFQKILKQHIESTLLPPLNESFKNSFSNLNHIQNRLTDDEFKLTLLFNKIDIQFKISGNNLIVSNINYYRKCTLECVNTNKNPLRKDEEIKFYFNKNKKNESSSDFTKEVFKEYYHTLYEVTYTANDIFFLPASRTGLYDVMSSLGVVIAKFAQSRHTVNEKIEIPGLSDAMSNYFINLSTIKVGQTPDVYIQIANDIEKNILNAEITFNNENKKLEYFNPKTNLRLDLSETSSMISEIAPVVAYLKYIINDEIKTNNLGNGIFDVPSEYKNDKPDKILIIEEPEAHLHPEIQVKLIDIFTRLINHNIKIVLTTHSNYIFNKVNNLILANELSTEKIANYHIVQTDEGSIVKNEENLTDAGITDENFADVAQKLYNERLEILHQD